MGQALYRKYRSKSLSEVVGQDHITKTLQNALKNGKISHAYLFTGPRGVGKTSVARILAHEVNNLPYKSEAIHLDIIEIDAASNRRIDEIRDLRDKVNITPVSAKYKVYIIDEVHMLTREAFNALLKTLEEPPEHCIFILATTEAHKLPETIISRTQRFNFKPIEKQAAAKYLAHLAKQEKIDITSGALEILAQHGGGSFRDSIGMLDQLSSSGQKINEETVRLMLGLPSETSIVTLLKAVAEGESTETLNILEDLREQSASPSLIASSISAALRKQLIEGSINSWATDLLRALLEVPASAQPYENLEICLLEAAAKNISTSKPEKNDDKLKLNASSIRPSLKKVLSLKNFPYRRKRKIISPARFKT
jgi:DNA polymerase-3 subunit gamma/tau